MNKNRRIVIENVLTVTMNKNSEIDVFTIVIENGKISSLTKKAEGFDIEKRRDDRIVEGKNRIAIPGLFNGHIHSDITLARGLGDGLTLYEQDNDSYVSRKRWFKNELDREARYHSKLLQYVEALKGGTTFLCDVPFWHYGDDLTGPLKETGIKGAVVLDYRKDFLSGVEVEWESYRDTVIHLKENGYLPIVEGPAEESYDVGLLKRLMDRKEELDTFIQMHLAETMWRVKITEEKFGKRPVKFLWDEGFLDSRVIGSHGVFINDDEIGMMKDAGARIVNCPTAEMKIADGIAPVVKLLRHSVPTGIGTDGALWNDSADIFSEMKNLMLLQRVTYGASSLDAYSCLYTATMGSARVFGLENELGSIEPGKNACIALIDYNKPHLVPIYNGETSNVLQIVTSCAQASDVDTVIVDGKIIMENRMVTTVDEEELLKTCQEMGTVRFRDLKFDG
jgi:5-methylthioadenosine/S-adenosylhomocysteine deaminase